MVWFGCNGGRIVTEKEKKIAFCFGFFFTGLVFAGLKKGYRKAKNP
jgi:hypothetical protein